MLTLRVGAKAMLSRVQCVLLALLCSVSLAGCAGDFLWWPGFNPVTAAYLYKIPVYDVALEVQCEIYQFLDDESEKNKQLVQRFRRGQPSDYLLLAKGGGAGVALNLQTDLSGSVQYVGIDLSKLGFASVATLVAATSKTPSLQAKATGKSTISAEVDFIVQQTKDPKFQANCANANRPVYQPYLELWLKNWLSNYKSYEAWYEHSEPFICNSKVTLKSAFQVVVDVSAGVNAFMTPPIILPISGFNVDASPDHMHSIQITFTLTDPNKDHAAYCKALAPQPATKI
jgi:hypothetical protein